MIRTHCPNCLAPYDLPAEMVGQHGRCSRCGNNFLITVSGNEEPHSPPTPTMNVSITSESLEKSFKVSYGSLGIATLIALLAAAAFYVLRYQPLPKSLTPWVSFLGEMHPLFVHFPIGLILVIALLGLLGRMHDPTVKVLLWVNLLTCAAAIVAGQAFALDSNEGVMLTRHLWFGVGVGVLSWLALCCFIVRETTQSTLSRWGYQLFLSAGVVALTIAGHLGASLTHGDILELLPWKTSSNSEESTSTSLSKGLPVEERSVLDAVIFPIMEARCISCHDSKNKEKKPKGELTLDTYQGMLAAGESEKPSIVPADPEKSESLKRILLPLHHDDHMPPNKKSQMEPAEVEVLRWWIQAGADPKMTLKDAPAPAEIKAKLKSIAANPPVVPAKN